MRSRFSAMRRAKRIIDIDIAQCSNFFRECFAVFLFTHIDAAVLQQHEIAGLKIKTTIDPIANQGHFAIQHFCDAMGYRSQAIFRFKLTFGWPAQMGSHHHCSSSL